LATYPRCARLGGREPVAYKIDQHLRRKPGKRGKSRGGQGERALARMIWGSGGMTWLPGTANRAPR
jgi:hypothetical protein